MINPPEQPINDEAQVSDCISTENEAGNKWCIITSNRKVLKFGSEI